MKARTKDNHRYLLASHERSASTASGLDEKNKKLINALGLYSLSSKLYFVRLDYGDIRRGTTSLAFYLAQFVFMKAFRSIY